MSDAVRGSPLLPSLLPGYGPVIASVLQLMLICFQYLGLSSQSSGLYPATILQLLRAEQPHSTSDFFLDGIKLDRVTCVACIVDIREYDYTTVYSLEDGSAGRLRATWSFGSETRGLLEEFPDLGTKDYVRVMGRLKVIKGVNHLNAEVIRPILDMHEIFFHSLEAIVTSVSDQRKSHSTPPAQLMPQVASQSPPSMQPCTAQTNRRAGDIFTTQEPEVDADTTLEELDRLSLVDYHTNEDLHELFQPPKSSFPPSPSRPPSLLSTDTPSETNNQPTLVLDPYSSLSLLQRDIIIQIHHNAPHFPDGIPITTMRRLVDRLTAGDSEIREAIDDLMDCGHLYLTINQNLKIVN